MKSKEELEAHLKNYEYELEKDYDDLLYILYCRNMIKRIKEDLRYLENEK